MGWEIETQPILPEKELSTLTSRKQGALRESQGWEGPSRPDQGRHRGGNRGAKAPSTLPDHHSRRIARPRCPSALVGADPRGACREINSLRANARVVAIDLPTGLDGDSGKADGDCVVADFTITIGCAKSGLVADSAIDFVGRLEVVPLDELRYGKNRSLRRTGDSAIVRHLVPRREIFCLTELIWPDRHRRGLARFYGRGDHVLVRRTSRRRRPGRVVRAGGNLRDCGRGRRFRR